MSGCDRTADEVVDSGPEREDCSCASWELNIPRINAPIFLQAARGRGTGYTGEYFRFCPWCGSELELKDG